MRILLAAVVLAAACAKSGPAVEAGSEVKMHYTLKIDGVRVDGSEGGEPLAYTQGLGQIVPGVEKAMLGKKAGEKFELRVEPKDAYGEPNPAATRKVPWKAFGGKKDLATGQVINGQANGQPFQAKVTAVDKDGVTIDLNHPLAGKTLDFAIEVVEVKPKAG